MVLNPLIVPERCVPRASYVRSIPVVLRFLRQLRRHPGVSAVDNVPLVHPLRLRGNGSRHLQLWTRETQVLPDVLPLQIARYHVGGARHD